MTPCRARTGMTMLTAAVLCVAPGSRVGATGNDPVHGTVFIRVIGNVRVLRGDDDRFRREVLLGLSDIPVATGTGFIVSADGWIVTNHHVVSGENRVLTIRGQKVEVAVEVQRIEVVVPGRRGRAQQFTASVSAADAELDLAVLYVSGQDLPYVALGDSDAMSPGEPVRALGYPFGDQVEIGRTAATGPDVPPDVTVSPGAVSSIRRDDAGEVRYVQTTAPLNPGNSGGPIVDADGYVVAVAQLGLRDRSGRGVDFGIPVNVVKRFLRLHALDQRLPVPLVGLAGYLEAPAKAVRLRVPDGFADQSPFRLRVDTTMSDSVFTLRIDRFSSLRTLEQIESAFLTEGVLDRFRAAGTPRRTARAADGRRVIEGYVTGSDPTTGQELSTVYALLDLGRERIVARYIGTAEAIAVNRSVLQASLAGLEARPLLTAEVSRPLPSAWGHTTIEGSSTTVPIPEGWLVEPGAPSPCGSLGPPSLALATSPPGDFTVQFRAAWRPLTGGDVISIAKACAPQGGAAGPGSYASSLDWWNVAFKVEGVFVATTGGVWHLEALMPASKSSAIVPAFTAWARAFAP